MANGKSDVAKRTRDFFREYDQTRRIADELSEHMPDVTAALENALQSRAGEKVMAEAVTTALKEDSVHDTLRELVQEAVRDSFNELLKDAVAEALQDLLEKQKLVMRPVP